MDERTTDIDIILIQKRLDYLEEQYKALNKLYEGISELKYTTKDLVDWKVENNRTLTKITDNLVQVGLTLQQLNASQGNASHEIEVITQEVDNLKSSTKITIKDIVQHVSFAILGAFVTLVFGIISGGH